MKLKIYSFLLRLDGPVLKSDNLLTKVLKRKILKPVGYYFRQKHFKVKYKNHG